MDPFEIRSVLLYFYPIVRDFKAIKIQVLWAFWWEDSVSTPQWCVCVSFLSWNCDFLKVSFCVLFMIFVCFPAAGLSSFDKVRVVEAILSSTETCSGPRHLSPHLLSVLLTDVSWVCLLNYSKESSCPMAVPHSMGSLHSVNGPGVGVSIDPPPHFMGGSSLSLRSLHQISGGFSWRFVASTLPSAPMPFIYRTGP